jgi:serine protease inhibitor ecotin
MKHAISLFLFSSIAAADCSQQSWGGELEHAQLSGGVWSFTMTNGGRFTADTTTPFKFRGDKRVKSLADAAPGSLVNVLYCVDTGDGICHTGVSAMLACNLPVNKINRTVTVTSVR